MKTSELLLAVKNIQDEKRIVFSTGDQMLSESFDRGNENRLETEDLSTSLAYTLYAWIGTILILRGQKKSTREKGYQSFEKEWSSVVKDQKEEIYTSALTEKENALYLIHQFLFENKMTKMDELMAKLAPLALLIQIKENPKEAKNTLKEFSKKKEMIFNQVLLFSRSLYHSFLKMDGLENDAIRPDYDQLRNGILLYRDSTLIIPTWQNAFTLESYRSVILEGLEELSYNFPISGIDSIGVIYLTKDIFAKYSF